MADQITTTTPITTTPITTSPATRQCGRCRHHFPVDVATHAMELQDWWACPACSTALMPGRHPASTRSPR